MLPLAANTPFIDQVQTWALTWMPILLMCALVYLIWRTLKSMPRTKPQQIKPEGSGAISWDDVAGCDEAKHELREVVEFLRTPDRFKKLGASVPKGIMLHGPPGTGKTLLAKAVATESGAQFFSQSASSFVEMFAGLGAARIRRLFAIAKKHRPAIIFIDELDAIGLQRGFDLSREKDQTLNQLLVEMDGFEDRGDLIVIAASTASTLRCCVPGASTARFSSVPRTCAVASRSCASTHGPSRSTRSTSRWSRAARSVSPVRTSPTSATRLRSTPAARDGSRSSRSTSTAHSSAWSPGFRRDG
jgi:hypothetical protein